MAATTPTMPDAWTRACRRRLPRNVTRRAHARVAAHCNLTMAQWALSLLTMRQKHGGVNQTVALRSTLTIGGVKFTAST